MYFNTLCVIGEDKKGKSTSKKWTNARQKSNLS